jgi:hypothetical protein
MTDELEPMTGSPTPEPATPEPEPTPITPSTPLTPASRPSPAAPLYEHEVAWASTTPVLAPRRPRQGGRMRWAISLVVVMLVIVTTGAIAALITGRSPDATVLGYVPDKSVVYGEVRLDLPGDQRQAVGTFLSKFPGFADQAALETKLDQVLDDLVKSATKDSQTYTTDIKPWFGGEIGFSAEAPSAAALSSKDQAAVAGSIRALALVSVKDAAGAKAWFDSAVAKTGVQTTTQTYGGATLTLFDKTEGVQAAFAILDGKVAVVGDLASVESAVDTNGASPFAKQSGPAAALAASDADHVGFVYVALGPIFDLYDVMAKANPQSLGSAAPVFSDALRKSIPAWGAYALRFENDAIVVDATSPNPETRIGPTENTTSKVTDHVPATAVFAAVGNDYGKTLSQMLDLYRSEPSFKSTFTQLDQALGLIGGQSAALDWIGDSAVVVNVSDGTPEFGIVVTPTDPAAATRLFTSLHTFIGLGAQQGISVHDEAYDGTTITTVDVGSNAGLSSMTGSDGGFLPAGHLEVAYAVTNDVVVVGVGAGFVKHVLDTTAATSLTTTDRYKALADRAGAGTGSVFVDVTTIRGLVEKAVNAPGGPATPPDPNMLKRYETDIKPFLAPFDAIYVSNHAGSDLSHSVVYLTVK